MGNNCICKCRWRPNRIAMGALTLSTGAFLLLVAVPVGWLLPSWLIDPTLRQLGVAATIVAGVVCLAGVTVIASQCTCICVRRLQCCCCALPLNEGNDDFQRLSQYHPVINTNIP